MTQKQKAKELVDRFRDYSYEYEVINSEEDTQDWNAKQCALICVDEMIDRFQHIPDVYCLGSIIIDEIKYLQEIKQEIESYDRLPNQ